MVTNNDNDDLWSNLTIIMLQNWFYDKCILQIIISGMIYLIPMRELH